MLRAAENFYQEIRDAIAVRDRLVLVVGPKALASEHRRCAELADALPRATRLWAS